MVCGEREVDFVEAFRCSAEIGASPSALRGGRRYQRALFRQGVVDEICQTVSPSFSAAAMPHNGRWEVVRK